MHEGDFGQQPTERLLPPTTAEADDDVILTPEEWQALQEAAGQILNKEEEDELPFACFICRRPWSECQDPVVTRCKHYFCEQCALQHNAKSKKCIVCEQPTGGIFNVANDILKREKENKIKAAGG